jgi:hypothetical protein
MVSKTSRAVLAFAAVANAQVPVWGQCGGIGYGGSTVCAPGAACSTFNDWYYQCVPATAATSATSATSVPVSTTKVPATTTTAGSVSTSKTPSASSSSAPPVQTGTKYFISFGDSYSQTGFNITGQKPSAANPLGNPPLPGWTASGGLDWPGFMVTAFNTSLTLSYNFAYGGATVDGELVAPYEPTVLSFTDQVGLFSEHLAEKPAYAPWTADNTVAGVWMGVNDVGNTFWLSGQEARYETIMEAYFRQVQIVYDAGVRKFVLLTMPRE